MPTCNVLLGMRFTPEEESHIESGSLKANKVQFKNIYRRFLSTKEWTGESFDVLGWEEKQKAVTKNRLL